MAQPLFNNTHSPAAQQRARRAVQVLFWTLGAMAGTWGAHIPSIKAHYAISEGALSLLLFAAAVGSVSALLFAGRMVGRMGVPRTAALAALSVCLALGTSLLFPSMVLLLPAMLVFGASMSLLDVAINAEGSELETLGGLPIMSHLHGMFSVGGLCGAGLAALLLWAGIAPDWQLPALCTLLALVASWASPRLLVAAIRPDAGPSPAHFVWPRGLLLVIGLLIFAGMTAEGVMADWCVLYLKQELGMSPAQAALGYAVFSGSMAVCRFAGDSLRQRYSETALLRFGATLAALAMALVLLSAQAWVAWVGFALVGAGLAPVAPILFQAATRVPGVSRAAAIAAVTSIGYSGFMLGPPLIGAIATTSSLSVAMGVVVLASVLLAWGSAWVPAPTGAT